MISLIWKIKFHLTDEKLMIKKKYIKNFKTRIHNDMNIILLILFLVILSIFAVTRTPYLFDYDNWFHVAKINLFSSTGFPSINFEYQNSFHFIFASFILISNIDAWMLGRYIGLFQITLSGLIFYNLALKLTKNRSISIITTLIFSFSALGPFNVLAQLWPTAIVFLISIALEILFLIHLEAIETSSKEKSQIITNLILMICLIFSIIEIHVISGYLLLIPLIGTLIIFSCKDSRYIWTSIVFIGLYLFNFILQPEGLLILAQNSINRLENSYFWLIIPVFALFVIFFYFFQKKVNMWTYSTKASIKNNELENNTWIKITEKGFGKIIIPICVFIGPFIYFSSIIIKHQEITLEIISLILASTTIAIEIAMGIIGINLIRKKSLAGKEFFIRLTIFGIILFGMTLLNIPGSFIKRLITLYSPIILVGVVLFFYYGALRIVNSKKIQKVLFLFFLIHFVFSGFFEVNRSRYWSSSEYNFAKNFGQHQDGQNFEVLSSFRWEYVFFYNSEGNMIKQRDYTFLIHPFLHDSDPINIKDFYDNQSIQNLYIVIDNSYFSEGILLLDGRSEGILQIEEFNTYYKLPYTNIVQCSTLNKYLIWVHP
jgi:hypothetical protein